MSAAAYAPVKGDLHRHGTLRHAHPHTGAHAHDAHGQKTLRVDHGDHAAAMR